MASSFTRTAFPWSKHLVTFCIVVLSINACAGPTEGRPPRDEPTSLYIEDDFHGCYLSPSQCARIKNDLTVLEGRGGRCADYGAAGLYLYNSTDPNVGFWSTSSSLISGWYGSEIANRIRNLAGAVVMVPDLFGLGWRPRDNRVFIRSNMTSDELRKTIAHELAHHYRDDDPEHTTGQAVIAEGC
jgi:hypothetical protein